MEYYFYNRGLRCEKLIEFPLKENSIIEDSKSYFLLINDITNRTCERILNGNELDTLLKSEESSGIIVIYEIGKEHYKTIKDKYIYLKTTEFNDNLNKLLITDNDNKIFEICFSIDDDGSGIIDNFTLDLDKMKLKSEKYELNVVKYNSNDSYFVVLNDSVIAIEIHHIIGLDDVLDSKQSIIKEQLPVDEETP
jgi:hypothetical protein